MAVAEALGLPAGSASALFALGRAAGWIAHVLEQRRSGGLVRPLVPDTSGPSGARQIAPVINYRVMSHDRRRLTGQGAY